MSFQFSAHVEWLDSSIDYVEALDIGGEDPGALIAGRLATPPTGGTVVAWDAGFERRTEDLLPIARSHYATAT